MSRIREDIRTVFREDPAARGVLEVLLCYPGLHATWLHRAAHWLWTHKLRLFGRLLSHVSRFLTGIEIHPGARIGRRFFIDHGMGVVIGETAEIGADVLMYQGVVLGGTSLEKKKRHPTVQDGVVIGAGAVLLGPIVVGEKARIGAGSVVIRSVSPGATVVGVPGRDIREKRGASAALEHANLPDPVLEMFGKIEAEQERINERLATVEQGAAAECWREQPSVVLRHSMALQDGAGI